MGTLEQSDMKLRTAIELIMSESKTTATAIPMYDYMLLVLRFVRVHNYYVSERGRESERALTQ